MLEELVDKMLELSLKYALESERFAYSGQAISSDYYAGKSAAMSYAAQLLVVEIKNNA